MIPEPKTISEGKVKSSESDFLNSFCSLSKLKTSLIVEFFRSEFNLVFPDFPKLQ